MIAIILGVPVAVHLQWVRAADAAYAVRATAKDTGSEAAAPEVTDPPSSNADTEEERARAEAERRYRAPRYPRTGHTTIRIEQGRFARFEQGRFATQAEARDELTLHPDDPMTEDLRRDAQNLGAWLPFTLTVASSNDGCKADRFHPSNRDWLEQGDPKEAVRAFATSEAYWYDTIGGCADSSTVITFTMTKGWQGKTRLYDRWAVTVESRTRPFTAVVGGTTLEQSAHRVELSLPEKGKVTIGLADSGRWGGGDSQEPTDVEAFAALLQKELPAGPEAVLLLAGVMTVTCCWVVPFIRRWAPPAVRRRWITVALVAGTLTCTTLAYGLVGNGITKPWHAWWAYPGRSVPLVLWWWVLLPFLLGAFVVRVTTGRPPSVRQLLPSVLPSMLLLVPSAVLCATERSLLALVPIAAATAAAALTAYALSRGLLGQAGRRWTATAVGGVWWAVLTAGPGTGLPNNIFADTWGRTVPWTVANVLAAGALAWGWPAVLCPVLARFPWRRSLGPGASLMLILWCVLSLSWLGSWLQHWGKEEEGGPWRILGVDPEAAANGPLIALPTIVFCASLLFLWRYGRQQERWSGHVRTATLSIGITAVATALTLSGIAPFGDDGFSSGPYLALIIAALGFAWLLPPAAEQRAVRLHGTSSRAHTRRMHALLQDQTLAAGRREFLVSSRTALAEGDLTPSQWSARWRGLGGLGGQRRLALRLAALGTSGGREAWRNGVVAASLLAVLSLPWFMLTIPSSFDGFDFYGIYAVSDLIELWTYAARWPLYGFIYGYAYAWLRGRTPLGKSMCLLAVLLPSEFAQLLYQDVEPGTFGARLLLTTGNCLTALLVLGLYWEARLVRAAGLRWGQIRNFRSLSALALPATTVLVAVATALATAVVGVWVAPHGGPSADAPKEQGSISGGPTPGPR